MPNIKDQITKGLVSITKPENALMLGAAKWAIDAVRATKKQDDPGSSAQSDPFKLSNFTAKLKEDAFRLSKGYYYIVYIFFPDNPDILEPLVFHCNKVTLPGWRAKTQQGKIYGIPYEIATELEQDPVWLTFNVDIRHDIENYFMQARKELMFDAKSFSPDYKDKYQFQMLIQVTDENFIPTYEYVLNNAILKTVQNVSYGAGSHELQQITVEVVYEDVTAVDVRVKRDKAKANPDAVNPNQLRVGPFTADISMVNLAINSVSKIPKWFEGPTKI